MNTLIASIISGLVVATVTSFITVRLSLRRFYSERWWERKADAYTDIIEALHAKLEFLDSYFSVMYDGEKLSEADINRMRAASKEADRKISKLVRIGTFVISEEVELIFQRYRLSRTRMTQEIYEGDEDERFRREHELVSNYLEDVRDAAMRDLKVTPWTSLGQMLELVSLTVRRRTRER